MEQSQVLAAVRQREVAEKRQRIQNFIEKHQLDGLALNTHNYFAWATAGGSNWVANDTPIGVATLLHLADGRQFAFANNIEVPRLQDEELLAALGYQVISQDWWANAATKEAAIWETLGGKQKKLGTDYSLEGAQQISNLLLPERFSLTADEIARYQTVGADAATALETTCRNLTPGMTEWEVAAKLVQECFSRGLLAFVTLVASDERIFKYRHPIPTSKKIEKYVMVVLCAKRGGLIANCTRLVHFGALPNELKQKQAAILKVDATFNLYSRPGTKVSDVFAKGLEAYAQAGFADEWKLHHQGGATGYNSRDYLGTPTSPEIVQENQTFAWNPSITGVKCEDTVLTSSERDVEVLTAAPNSSWPTASIEIAGQGTLRRSLILEL